MNMTFLARQATLCLSAARYVAIRMRWVPCRARWQREEPLVCRARGDEFPLLALPLTAQKERNASLPSENLTEPLAS